MYFFDDTWSILDEHMASYQLEYSNKIRVTEWIMILIRTARHNLTDLDFILTLRTDYCIFCVLEIVTDILDR